MPAGAVLADYNVTKGKVSMQMYFPLKVDRIPSGPEESMRAEFCPTTAFLKVGRGPCTYLQDVPEGGMRR